MAARTLIIDTALGACTVLVAEGERITAVRSEIMARGHQERLGGLARDVIAEAGGAETIERVAVTVGPGSFTGLRIAGATAKGLLQALGIPLYGYSGLLAAAAAAWSAPGPVCALFDARRRDVFAACYRFGGSGGVEVVMNPAALALDALIERFRGEQSPLFVGEGAQLHRAELERELGARVGPAHLSVPRASALVWLTTTVPALGLVAEPSAWEPEYLRASGAERIAAARGAGGEG